MAFGLLVPASLRGVLVGYATTSLCVLALGGAASAAVASEAASASTLHDAAVATEAIALDLVAPYVTPELLDGDPRARSQLGEGLAGTGGRDGILHLTVRDRTGAVLWSDEPSLVGRVDALDPEEVALLQQLGRHAEMRVVGSGGQARQPAQQVIDADSATLGVSGDPVMVEAQLGTERLLLARDEAIGRATPLALAVILLVQALLLPVVLAAARRVRRARQERAAFHLLAERAAVAERRAVAAQLHDTVVQDLVGLGFAFDGMRLRQMADRRREGAVAAGDELVERMHGIVTADILLLRGIIDSLAVREPVPDDFSQVLPEMVEQASAAGIVVRTRVDHLPELSSQARTALHLVAREAVRNAVRHSRANRLEVLLRHDGDDVELVVSDDGQGIPPDRAQEAGHLGLVLYRQAAEAAGGEHTLISAPGQGTRVVLRVPTATPRRKTFPSRVPGLLQRTAPTSRRPVPPVPQDVQLVGLGSRPV